MLYILDRAEKKVGVLQTKSDRRTKNIYFDDVHYQELSTGAESLTFSAVGDRAMLANLVVGNYISFRDKNDKLKLMQIMNTEEVRESFLVKDVYCETCGLELINSVYDGVDMHGVDIRRFLSNVLQDTTWNVGYIDGRLVRTLALEVKTKEVYSLIQENAKKFDAEISFRVEKRDGHYYRYVDAHYKRNSGEKKRLEIKRDVKKISRKVDMTKFATKLKGRGKDGITFKDVTVPEIDKALGEDFLVNKDAYATYNLKGNHITRIYEYDTTDPLELLRQTEKALKEYSKIQATYEVDADILDIDNVVIGQTVSVCDYSFEPPLIVQARIATLEQSKTDKTKSKATLSNFEEIESGISKFPIGGNDIINGAIGDNHIQDGAVHGNHIIVDSIDAGHIKADTITAEHITAESIESHHIQADTIEGNHIKGNTIEGSHIKGGTITGDLIQGGTITGDNIQAGSITAGSGIIAEGAIGNAEIAELNANKITGGTIDSSKVDVSGPSGNLLIRGNRLQVFEGHGNSKVERISLGDVDNDGTAYGLRVRGKDGQTVLYDENGVYNEGITDGAITNEKISGETKIDGYKLDIDSVVREINGSTEVIEGTKININGTNLEVELSNQKNTIDEHTTSIDNNKSAIEANTEKLNLKVDNTVYNNDKEEFTTTLEKNSGEISALKDKIALKVEKDYVENALKGVKFTRADYIARNLLTTPLVVTDPTLEVYAASGIPNPPMGAVFNSFNQKDNTIKNNSVSSNGTAWAIIAAYEFYNNTTDKDKIAEVVDLVTKVANFMVENVAVGRFNSMNFKFIDTNYKYSSSTKEWTKSNYKEIYISTLWLQVKALVYAYEILENKVYLNTALDVLDSLFNTHFYMNAGVVSGDLPKHLEWSSYEYLACDNISSSNRFSASTRQYANQMGYYIHQAIKDVIRVVGDDVRSTPKGDKYKPSDVLVGLKKYLKNAYENQGLTAQPLGLPYGYFHRVSNPEGGYDYIPQNWDFIENTWGDTWFVGDVVTYTIYAFAACGLTDIAREYANNYYKLRVNNKEEKWSKRFTTSELLFYDRIDFHTGTHLPDDDSISITYTALFYDILKEIGLNEYIDACCYTLAKHQIDNLENKDIDGGYPWDVSKEGVSIEFKSFGEIINSQFYKNLNVTNFTFIDNEFAAIDISSKEIKTKVQDIESTQKRTAKVGSFRYVRDCLYGSSVNDRNHIVELQVWAKNVNLAQGKQPTSNTKIYDSHYMTDGNYKNSEQLTTLESIDDWVYAEIDLGEIVSNADMIKVWHYYLDEREYNHKLMVSKDGVEWQELYNSDVSGCYAEDKNGRTYILNESYSETRLKTAEEQITPDAIVHTVKTAKTDEGKNVFAQSTELEQTVKEFNFKFENSGSENVVKNAWFVGGMSHWEYVNWWNEDDSQLSGEAIHTKGNNTDKWLPLGVDFAKISNFGAANNNHFHGINQVIDVEPGKTYTFSLYAAAHRVKQMILEFRNYSNNDAWIKPEYINDLKGSKEIEPTLEEDFTFVEVQVEIPKNCSKLRVNIFSVGKDGTNHSYLWVGRVQLEKGLVATARRLNSNEVSNSTTTIDDNGVKVKSKNATQSARMDKQFFSVYDGEETDTNRRAFMGMEGEVPSIILGANGVNPGVNVHGGTHITMKHYKPHLAPRPWGGSWGTIEYKLDSGINDKSIIGMTQEGDINIMPHRETRIWKNLVIRAMNDDEPSVRVGYLETYIDRWGVIAPLRGIKVYHHTIGSDNERDVHMLNPNGIHSNLYANIVTAYSAAAAYKIPGVKAPRVYREDSKIYLETTQVIESLIADREERIAKEQAQEQEIIKNMLANTEMFEMMAPMMVNTLNARNDRFSNMAEVYASLINKGVKTIEEVPAIILEKVKEILE